MSVPPIVPVGTAVPASSVGRTAPVGGNERVEGESFSGMLENAVGKLGASLNQADDLAMRLAAGEDVDVHQVMIAMESASIGLQTAIQIRNKAIEAYREIMSMPV